MFIQLLFLVNGLGSFGKFGLLDGLLTLCWNVVGKFFLVRVSVEIVGV